MVMRIIALSPALDALADDTEEALLGTSIHQSVIVTLDTGLNYYSRRAELPWLVGNQLRLVIPRPGGRPAYHPSPDILAHVTLGGVLLASLPVAQYGPPALAIEVCSPDPPAGGCPTVRDHDLDTLNPDAKPRAYEECGIPEYLVFDPIGDIVPDPIRAWRIGPAGRYIPWLPDPVTGHWHSVLGISFAPIGILLRVYDPDGNLIPTINELTDENAAQADHLDAQAREIATLRAALARRPEGEE